MDRRRQRVRWRSGRRRWYRLPSGGRRGVQGVLRQRDGAAGSDGENGLQHGAGERAEEVRRAAARCVNTA